MAGTKEEYEEAVRELKAGSSAIFSELSKLRHEVALAKVPYVIEQLKELIEEEEKKVICFAHHKDVIAAIMAAFPGVAVQITGDTPMQARQDAVEAFQGNDKIKLFVGSITAAGVGLTLTAASHVIFAELDWVPGNITQCEDRAHRIGQTNSVLVQHLVLEGSLDAYIADTLVAKQTVIDQALDNATDGTLLDIPVIPSFTKKKQAEIKDLGITAEMFKTSVLENTSFDSLEKQANETILPAEQVEAIHQAVRIIAGVCDGACKRDEMGFNGCDTRYGHILAKSPYLTNKQALVGLKMAKRYKRQIGGELLSRCTG
jgi:hypothetical protein